jgi:hypothetical protein
MVISTRPFASVGVIILRYLQKYRTVVESVGQIDNARIWMASNGSIRSR